MLRLFLWMMAANRHLICPALKRILTARNFGVRRAKGEYLILTDIDHIISSEVIEVARNPSHDIIRFSREAGVLTEDGSFTQDFDTLRQWGLMERYIRKNLSLPPHGNSYIFRKSLY